VACATAVLTAILLGAPSPAGDAHPRVFLTAADVARVQKAVATRPDFARWAEQLVRRAETAKIADLPPLERAWWEKDRSKPWRDTYPQVFHHTWIVPERWAELARDCARAHLVRPAAKLDQKGKQVLLALAGFTFEFEHYDVGLNYTVWSVAALEAYDILYDAFTPAERKRVDAFFARFLAALEKNDRYWIEHEPGGALNNHYAWHKLAFVAMGLFYDRPELVERAFTGPKGIEFLMRHGFTDDGLWLEGSIPYQLAATTPLVWAAEMLENAGHKRRLYTGDAGDGRTLKSAYDALIPLVFPDRTLPAIGDCYGVRPHLARRPDWETLNRRFPDPRYAWLLSDAGRRPHALFQGAAELPVADPPGQFSKLWPEHGYAALRSVEGPAYWTGRGWTLFATWSNHLVHENADKLSVQLFADGHLWLPDCEAKPSAEHSFSAPVQSALNRETLCHNTLLVDAHSQRFPDGRLDLVEYQVLPQVKRVSMGDLAGRLYPGVRQLRTCLVRADYVLDFFQVQADRARSLAWVTHVDALPAGSSSPGPAKPFALPGQAPWSYLRGAEEVVVPGPYWEVFRHGERRFRIDLATSSPQQLVRCGFPRDDGPKAEVIPMRMFRSDASSAWYAAVYRSGVKADEPLKVSVVPGPLDSWLVTVDVSSSRFVHRLPRLPNAPLPGKAVGSRQ